MSYDTQKFLSDYGVRHRVSSVAFAHSNQRAELGVKSMKRLIRDNTCGYGSLEGNRFLQALMQYRNTPDRDTGLSPAQVIFGRNLRDFLPAPQKRYKPQAQWILMREDREKALAKRCVTNMEKLAIGTKALPKLDVGDNVLVQNQIGNHPSKWHITGVVVEAKEHDQYVIRIDGSGRMTLRNRKFLRKITPYSNTRSRAEPQKRQAERSDRSVEAELPTLSPPPTTPLTPSTSHEPSPTQEPRRSSRTTKAPERLVMNPGAKSYAEAVMTTDPCSIGNTFTSITRILEGEEASLSMR